MPSSKAVSLHAPYCADCRGKDHRDCITCSKYPPNVQKISPEKAGRGIYSTKGEDGKEKFHYAHDGD